MANVQLEYMCSLSRTLILLTIIAYVMAQSQDSSRVRNPATLARRRTGTSSHTGTHVRGGQRSGIIQLRRPLPQLIDQPRDTSRTSNLATLTRQRSQVRRRDRPRTRIIQLRRPLPQVINQSFNESFNEWINQASNQSINQSLTQSLNVCSKRDCFLHHMCSVYTHLF